MTRTMTERLAPLTDEEEAAIRDFALRHGWRWKSELRNQWMKASASQPLHALRNSHGPTWLAGYRLPARIFDA